MNSTTNELRGKRAIIYSRVSTGDQVEGYSLKAQDEQLIKFCTKNGIEIVKAYREEGASAKTFKRPEFQKAQKLIEKNRNDVDFFLVYSWDRFSRNMFDAFSVIKKFESYGVEVNSITQWLDYSDPNQLFLFSIHLATPEVENRHRSDKSLTGMMQAKREGRWVHAPPFGYKMINKYMVPCEKQAPFVREAFLRISDGNYFSVDKLRRELNKKHGVAVKKSNFYFLLRKKVYAGLVEVKAHKKEPAQVVQGVHEPLVSPEVFHRVQNKLSKTPSRQVGKHDHNQDFVLRGFLWCEKCSRFLTASYSRSRNGNKHAYYHCDRSPGCERYRAQAINKKFQDTLERYTVPKPILNLYRAILFHIFSTIKKDTQETTENLMREQAKLDEKLLRLEVRFAEGEIEGDSFSRVKSLYQKEILTIGEQLDKMNSIETDYEKHLDYGISFLSNLSVIYENEGVDGKRRIIGSVFEDKIILENLEPRTSEINNVLLYLASLREGEQSIGGYKIAEKKQNVLSGPPLTLHLEHLDRILALRHSIPIIGGA